MKVLQINSVCGIGSTGRIATDIHQLLTSQNHESYIAYGRGQAMNCDSSIKIGRNIDNYMHVAKSRLLDKHGFGSRKPTNTFIETLKGINPDIIHLHNVHGYYINIESLFKFLRVAGKPVLWTLHDCWSFTGHCAHFDLIGCEKWKIACKACPQIREYPKSLVDKSNSNFSTKKELFTDIPNMTIVTPSEWLSKKVKDSFLKDYTIKTIHNGIDLSVFTPTKSDMRERLNIQSKFVILGVASVWGEKKGLNYFIELAKEIDENDVIVLVGLTKDQQNGLPDNVIGINRTNSIAELAEIYSAADVFINPTLEEVMGLTNIESLACGTPVISFNTGGCVECIDSTCGITVEKGNFTQLLTSINSVKEMSKKHFSANCTSRARQFFNKEHKFNEYIDLYKSKISSR